MADASDAREIQVFARKLRFRDNDAIGSRLVVARYQFRTDRGVTFFRKFSILNLNSSQGHSLRFSNVHAYIGRWNVSVRSSDRRALNDARR